MPENKAIPHVIQNSSLAAAIKACESHFAEHDQSLDFEFTKRYSTSPVH